MADRLRGETSPYLRQHADNPVDWWPWGDDARAEATRRDVPLFVSIGYSACHWCHVMAHESFEDPATAAVVNELFVPVKVDREERPDVDEVYMAATLALTGSGGWPMSVWLLPDGRPFLAGTYFPPARVGGRPSFVEVCRSVASAWVERRSDLVAQAEEVTAAVAERTQLVEPVRLAGAAGALDPADDGPTPEQLLDAALAGMRERFDPTWGGFGRAPKFPQPSWLELALRAHHATPGGSALAMVERTLERMAAGGIWDHLGGGFARYSTDERWYAPHFEKMLYDQAGLLRVYVHAWQATGDPRWRAVAARTVAYVDRDLGRPGRGWASAEDADAPGPDGTIREGAFAVWNEAEVVSALAGTGIDPDAVCASYGVTSSGAWEDGRSILWRAPGSPDLGPLDEAARAALFAARARRPRPGLDDKVLVEWNAMWIAALAEAGAALDQPGWVDDAERGARFLLEALRVDGRWRRAWQAEAGARHLATAQDHAWLVEAFTRLAEATGRASWLEHADRVADRLVELFLLPSGGLATVGSDAEQLVVRAVDRHDGATPAASSVAADALARLAALTSNRRWREVGDAIVDAFAPSVAEQPLAHTALLASFDRRRRGLTEVVVTGDRPDLLAVVRRAYLPDVVLSWGERPPGGLWDGRGGPDEEGPAGRAYVCRDGVCALPVSDPGALRDQLRIPSGSDDRP